MVHSESLLAVTGALDECNESGGVPRSPGLLLKHYAPEARLVVWQWSDNEELSVRLSEFNLRPENVHLIVHSHIPPSRLGHVGVLPHEPEAFARALYAELHRADANAAKLIVVEAVPSTPAWHAIADRLRRASA
jgi:L-threonylcarbamoyladenylate synthase